MSTLIRPAATDARVERCARRRARDARGRDSALEKDARDVGSRWSLASTAIDRAIRRVREDDGWMTDGGEISGTRARGGAGTKTSDDDGDID